MLNNLMLIHLEFLWWVNFTFVISNFTVFYPGDSAGGNLVITVGYHLAKMKTLHKTSRVPKVLIPLNPTLQIADLHIPSFRDENTDCVVRRWCLWFWVLELYYDYVQTQCSFCVLPLCVRWVDKNWSCQLCGLHRFQ